MENLITMYNELFTHFVPIARKQQETIFGKSFVRWRSDKRIIYTNNFYVCLDMSLRMTYLIYSFIMNVVKKYKIKRVFVIHTPIQTPRWRPVMAAAELKYPLSERWAYIESARRLESLEPYLTHEEEETYIPFEKFIAKSYPWVFNSTLSTRYIDFTYNREKKIIAKNKFFHMIQILQTAITKGEWEYIYYFVLYNISRVKGIRILQEEGGISHQSSAAELAAFFNSQCDKKSLIVSQYVLPSIGIYKYDLKNDVVKETSRRKLTVLNVPYLNIYKCRKCSVNELFDVCEDEMCNGMLAIDIYNTFNIFNNPIVLYKKVIRPKTYEEFEISYTNILLDKNMVIDVVREFLPKYNSTFGLNVV